MHVHGTFNTENSLQWLAYEWDVFMRQTQRVLERAQGGGELERKRNEFELKGQRLDHDCFQWIGSPFERETRARYYQAMLSGFFFFFVEASLKKLSSPLYLTLACSHPSPTITASLISFPVNHCCSVIAYNAQSHALPSLYQIDDCSKCYFFRIRPINFSLV